MDINEIEDLLNYQDEKADSRMDALLNSIDSIKFWVRIIGIYILAKIVIIIIAVAMWGYTFAGTIKWVNSLLQQFD